jgi:non-specific serine/threonine protein kinase
MSTAQPHDASADDGAAAPQAEAPTERGDALAPGTRIDGLQIERVIAGSGFSFVYEARDLALECSVALKEYLPGAIARRSEHRVVARSAPHAHAFEQGKRAFMQEAQMLARCDHPALVRVTRLWASHGTAYRTMPLYMGRSLLAARHAMSAPPDETWLRSLLDDLLGALEAVHDAGYVHRRVLPSNILVRTSGRAVLMDFDAVRHTLMSDKAQSLMAALDTALAIEPDFATDQLPQTAASDLHALAATLHFCVTGQPPALAGSRLQRDSLAQVLVRLRDAHPALRYDPALVGAIDRALHPDPAQWPQSVGQFREWLAVGKRAELPGATAASPQLAGATSLAADAPGAAVTNGIPSVEATPASPDRASAKEAPTETSEASDDGGEPPHIEFFPGFGQRPGIDAAPPLGPRGGMGAGLSTPRSRDAAAGSLEAGARPASRRATSASARPGTRGFAESRFDSRLEPQQGSRADSRRDSRFAHPSIGIEGMTASRFGPDGPGSRYESVFDDDAADAGNSVFGNARRPQPPTYARRPSKLLPWGVAAGVMGLALLAVWKMQDQREYDRVLVELARNAPPPAFGPASAPALPSTASAPSATIAAPGTSDTPPATDPIGLPSAAAAAAGLAAAGATAAVPPPSSRSVAEISLPQEPTSAGPRSSATLEAEEPPLAARRERSSTRRSSSTARAEAARAEAAARAESARTRNPRDACGNRTQFALYRCMETQCARAQWTRHPTCIRFRSGGDIEG